MSCEWWSEKHAEEVEKAQNGFESLWNDESPAIKVMTLPKAVREKLVMIGSHGQIPKEIDGSTAVPPEVPALKGFLVRHRIC